MKKNAISIFTFVAFVSFIVALALILFNWSTIPNEVPTHYNVKGEPDKWGDKWFIFFPPLFGLVMWGFIRAVGSIKLVNIPGYTDEKDLNESQKKNNKILMLIVSNMMLIVMSLLSMKEMLTILGHPISLGYGEIIIILTLLVGPVLFFSYRSIKLGHHN